MALLEKAAGQGHAYAMLALGGFHTKRKEYEQAAGWLTKGAEAGLPRAMYVFGNLLAGREGVAAPDYPAAADWFRRAANAGIGNAGMNLCAMYNAGSGRAGRIMPVTSSSTSQILVY
jgi:TPR repeat protein